MGVPARLRALRLCLCSCFLLQQILILILIPPQILILILIPDPCSADRLRGSGAMPFVQGPWVPMPRTPEEMAAAMLWPSVQDIFREARYGMQPMSWSSLGVDAKSDRYLNMLAQEKVVAIVKVNAVAQRHYERRREHDCSDSEKDLMQQQMNETHFMATMEDVRHHDLARHYGMCLCHAFCKHIAALGHLPPAWVQRAPYVVGLIEEFLNG